MHASNAIFGVLEIPFLILCIYFAFRTAVVLRGGIFGRGMALLAWAREVGRARPGLTR